MIGIKENRQLLEENNYILKADESSKYWFGLSKTRIDYYLTHLGRDFNIILIGSDTDREDYYCIPYNYIEDLLVAPNLSNSKNRQRWVGDIQNHYLHIRNASGGRNVASFYGLPCTNYEERLPISESEINDYVIENAKREVYVRLKQSLFRRRVLENYNYECCLTGLIEENLLVASHIIPWADQTTSRLDPSNGLCLSYIYDKLFDRGYFTIDVYYRVVISSQLKDLSSSVQLLLKAIDQRVIASPANYMPSKDALLYHSTYIFEKF